MSIKKQTEVTFELKYTDKEFRHLQKIVQEWKEDHPMFQPQPTTGSGYQASEVERQQAAIANEILREGAATR